MAEIVKPISLHSDKGFLREPELLLFLCHEMRTVLSKIVGYSELMYDAHQTNREKFDCIAQIRGRAREGESVLQEIVELCGADLGTLPVESKRFPLLQELGELALRLKADCQKQRQGFHFSFGAHCPPEIVGDPIRIIQILQNVAAALIDTSQRGTLTLRVTTAPSLSSPPRETITFTFESTASNLSSDDLDRELKSQNGENNIFLLVQNHSQISMRISEHLVRTLSGKLKVEKMEGSGSRVVISIDALTCSPDSRVVTNPSREKEEFGYGDLQGCKILVLEDDPDVQALLAHFLKKKHAQVDLASNGKIGLEKVNTSSYDVILMDLEMPVFDGLQTAEEMRTRGIKTPIIILTAHAISSVRDKCLKAGSNAFLTKPFDPGVLMEVVSQYARPH